MKNSRKETALDITVANPIQVVPGAAAAPGCPLTERYGERMAWGGLQAGWDGLPQAVLTPRILGSKP